jgi:hypothetical protein
MFYSSIIRNSAAESTAMSAEREARNAKNATDFLKFDVERLLMITEALWTLLKQQHGYKDEDLAKLVTEIDLRDGKLDGRIAPSEPRTCPSCGHVPGKHRPNCIYCGKPVAVDPFGR